MKQCKYYKVLFLVLGLTVFTTSYSQQNNTMYLLHDIPQSNLLNPAVQLNCKWYFGLPLFTSTYFNYSNTTFALNELFSRNTDTASINISKLYDNIRNTNLLNTEMNLDLLSLGFHFGGYYYLTFNIQEKASLVFTYPGSLVELLWKGNTQFLGETEKFNNLRIHASYYREYSFGFSNIKDEKSTWGVRAKFLFGKANIYSGKSEINMQTNSNTFDIKVAGDMSISSSFPITIDQNEDGEISGITTDDVDVGKLITNNKNKGFAVDFGWIYKYDEFITLSASILDFGFIRWETDANNVRIKGSYTYKGMGLEQGTDQSDFFSSIADSISKGFDQTVKGGRYYSWLPTQIYLGGTYKFHPILTFGAVNRNTIYRNKLHSSFTLSANLKLKKSFAGSLSWSYLNNSFKNIGVAVAWFGEGGQFHITSDNVLGFFKPFDARNISLRFGAGFMLGCSQRDKKQLKIRSKYKIIKKANCTWYKVFLRKQKRKKELLNKN